MKTEISVLFPVYNGERFLRDAIESILMQTFSGFEFIIINDGSTDSSEEIILSYKDKRIRYIKNEKNLGLIATLNKGIDLAIGKYIARMDADDIALPQRFEKQLNFIESQKADLVCSPVSFINARNEVVADWNMNEIKDPLQIRKHLPFENCIAHPTVLVKTELLRKYKYDPQQKGSEDWDLWIRMSSDNCRIVKTSEILLHYRYHTGSVSQKDNRVIRTEDKVLKVRRQFIAGSISGGKVSVTVLRCLYANFRTRLRILKVYTLAPFFRLLKRLFTINPFKAFSQLGELKKKLPSETSLILVFPYSHVGGAERVHADIVHALSAKKPLVIFAGIHKDSPYISNFRCEGSIVINAGYALNYFFTKKSAEALIESLIHKNNKAKILGCNAQYFYELAGRYAQTHEMTELTHDYTFSNTDSWSIENIYLLLSFRNRIFVSNRARQEAAKLYDFFGFPEEKKQHLKWIVNSTFIPADRPVKTVNEKLRVVFVGRNSPEKRPELGFRIASEAVKKNKQLHFSFVGDFEERQIKNATFHGIIYDVAKMLTIWKESDVLLLTSEREGFPMVVMEAMAHGVVPVCTPVGDIPLHVNSDRGVLLSNVSEDEVVNSAVKIILNLAANKRPLEQMSVNSYNYARTHFSFERFKKEYNSLL